MKQTELNEILQQHKLWLEDNGGSRADLSGANLSGADLSRADLSRANLSGADLSRADLSRADLSGANLSRADLSRADLSRADLSGANLDFSVLPLWCGSLSAKFDKKHYVQFLYHILKSLEQNDLVDDEFKQQLLTEQNIKIANQFHRVAECGKINDFKENGK